MNIGLRMLDSLLRHAEGIREFSNDPQCLLRIRFVHTSQPLELPTGRFPPGTAAIELHFWNEHIPRLPERGPDLAWGTRFMRALLLSFRLLANYIATDAEIGSAELIGGYTILGSGDAGPLNVNVLERLGFTILPARSRLGSFGEFWVKLYMWWIMGGVNPQARRGRQLLRLRRLQIWMTMTDFLSRYGEPGLRRT